MQETHPGGEKAAARVNRDRRIERVASRQLRLITTRQLLAAGLSHNGVHKRVLSRRLFRLHRGVCATHAPPYTREQRCLAAVLACGPDACLTGLHAAAIQGFAAHPASPPLVIAPRGRGRSRRGILVREGVVDPRDRRRAGGVPCTSAARILVELAPELPEDELETLLVAAESKRLLNRRRLNELVAERRGLPGIPKLERITALKPAFVRSDLELLFLPLWRIAGVERPRVNFPIEVPGRERPLTVDFAWPDIRMVVETDSQRFHGDWERAEIDRERDQLLALAGWLPHRFVRRRVKADPEGSAARLRDLVAVRAASFSPGR